MNISKSFVIILVLVIVIGGGVWVYLSFFSVSENPTVIIPVNNIAPTENKKIAIKETKRFTFVGVADSGVAGDGSATLKDTLTSFGLRLTSAPELKSGEFYEAYVVIKEGTDPQLIGVFIKARTKNEKFIAGGAGATSWYYADRVLVTKRATSEPKPGVVVAEVKLSAVK